MNIWERLATYIVVTTTKNCNQDEIFVAHTCGTSNCMICVDFDTIKMTRWLLASGRQSWLAKYIVGQEEKEDLPAYDAGCTKDEDIDVHRQDSINDAMLSKSGQLSLSLTGSLGEMVGHHLTLVHQSLTSYHANPNTTSISWKITVSQCGITQTCFLHFMCGLDGPLKINTACTGISRKHARQ